MDIRAPAATVRNFFRHPDMVLRLNPSWHVKDTKTTGDNEYSLVLYDDGTEDSITLTLAVEETGQAISYRMNSGHIEFLMEDIRPQLTKLSVRGDFFRAEDLPYWLNGIRNYIRLVEKKSRGMKWFLDRFWLRMTPSQRRIVVILLLAEGIGLAALVAVAIALQFMK
ncbi:MAG: hypothetical protein ACOYVJ_04950 [Nitrospirota bacterium]